VTGVQTCALPISFTTSFGRAVGRWRHAERAAEARRERADAPQPHRKTDLGDCAIGRAQEQGGSLEPADQEVLMRSRAEGTVELAAEVRGRQSRRAGKRAHVELIAVASVNEVSRAQEVPRGMDVGHCPEYLRHELVR